eukprot:COSAG06_NODE_58960_length_275_cov_1.176136_1_plen_23_part_10
MENDHGRLPQLLVLLLLLLLLLP